MSKYIPNKILEDLPDKISNKILSKISKKYYDQCSLADLNHDHPRPVFAAGSQLLCQKLYQIACQKIYQIECQIGCLKKY